MKFLVIIPARGGSKGVPKKNIKKLNGKPLIHYSIEAAQSIFPNEQICVSTDSEAIKEVAEQTGLKVPFIRPDYLSTDTAGTYEVLLHALEYFQKEGSTFEGIILLQPTSPFRTGAHLKEALDLYDSSIDMVVSVKETAANPYYLLFEENEEGFLKKSKEGNFTRRQDCPKVWEYNGAIYIINVKSLLKSPLHQFTKVRKYIMDERSSVDIDTPLDFTIAEILCKA